MTGNIICIKTVEVNKDMSVIGLNPVVASSGSVSVQKNDSLGKDDFLNLLVTQLQYQDPLNPLESAEFTAQLAQFSSLEQLGNVNDNLEELKLYQASSNNAQAVDFIGKSVKSTGNSIQLTEEVPVKIRFETAADAVEVSVHIYDSNGLFVNTIEAGALTSGEKTITWDGTNSKGFKVPEGAYNFEVVAVDIDGREVETSTYIVEKITGATFKGGATYLLAGDREIPLGDVLEITGN